MSRVVFITDMDTPLGEELTRLNLENGNHVFATVSNKENLKALKESTGDDFKIELWNRESPISAVNMLLKAKTYFPVIDEFLIIGNTSLKNSPIHIIDFYDIEKATDSWIKGNFFLIKEIMKYNFKKKSGVLALICQNFNTPSSPLDEAVKHGFWGLTQSLLRAYKDKEIIINGFESGSSDLTRHFASYIYKTIKEKARKISGRWFRFHGSIIASGSGFKK